MNGERGVIYLLHFSKAYAHAKHYTGWTRNLPERLAEHEAGRGARLLEVVREAGITWELARTWEGPRARERQLKQRGASRHCPRCKEEGKELMTDADRTAAEAQAAREVAWSDVRESGDFYWAAELSGDPDAQRIAAEVLDRSIREFSAQDAENMRGAGGPGWPVTEPADGYTGSPSLEADTDEPDPRGYEAEAGT